MEAAIPKSTLPVDSSDASWAFPKHPLFQLFVSTKKQVGSTSAVHWGSLGNNMQIFPLRNKLSYNKASLNCKPMEDTKHRRQPSQKISPAHNTYGKGVNQQAHNYIRVHLNSIVAKTSRCSWVAAHTHLEVTVHDAHVMQVFDSVKDLSDELAGVPLRIKPLLHNPVKEFPT